MIFIYNFKRIKFVNFYQILLTPVKNLDIIWRKYMLKLTKFYQKVLKMITTKNYNFKTKANSKRGRNLLTTEIKNFEFNSNISKKGSSKRKHNMLIDAYKITDWNENER